MTSDTRFQTPQEDEAVPSADEGASPSTTRADVDEQRPDGGAGEPATDTRLALPVVPVLAVLLVLLLGAVGFLWFTRPGESAVTTGDYVEALQAARSSVVDFTSFDHLTLDDDIEQIRRITTAEFEEESVAQLDERRQQITDGEVVVNTEVIGAGVTAADADDATVLLLIQSTQESSAAEQARIVKYRIQVELQKTDGRWLLAGIAGR